MTAEMSPPLQPNAASPEPALRAQGLSRRWPGRAVPVFGPLDLQIAPREIVCLLGGSGCGKSTLLRALAGLEPPHEGCVEFMGQALTQPHPRAVVVFQQPSLLPWLNVQANVGFGLDFKHQPASTRAERESRIGDALAAVGLAGKGGLYPSQLSGGMAQRVALARALAREPALLLADEPFSAVDAITRTELQDLLVEVVHRWHSAALLVTHDIDEALLVADRIVLMGGHPGEPAGLVREWAVGLSRPRLQHPAELTRLRLDILAALQDLRAAH